MFRWFATGIERSAVASVIRCRRYRTGSARQHTLPDFPPAGPGGRLRSGSRADNSNVCTDTEYDLHGGGLL